MSFFGNIKLKVLNIINNYDSNNTLTVDGFHEKDHSALKINNLNFDYLYCLELSSASNLVNYLPAKLIDNLHRKFRKKKDGFFIRALPKKNDYQKNYILSFNKDLLEMIARYYGLKLSSGVELINILYDLQLGNEYNIDRREKCLKKKVDLAQKLAYETSTTNFNRLIKDTVYDNLNDMNLYQAVSYKDIRNRNTQKDYLTIRDYYKMKFNGCVWQYISFNSATAKYVIEKNILDSKQGIETKDVMESKIHLEEIRSGYSRPVTINTVLVVSKDTDSINVSSDIGDIFQVVFRAEREGRSRRERLLQYTLLIEKNKLWSKVLEKEFLYDYIPSVHKMDSPNPHIYGVDANRARVNFNFMNTTYGRKNTRPHFFVGGKTGSTKTTLINLMKTQIVDFDWKTKTINKKRKIKFREFDIKKSLRYTTEHVHKYHPDMINIMDTDLNEFSYNLVGLDIKSDGAIDENDLAFCKTTTNFILMSKDSEGGASLTVDEDALYGAVISEIYEKRKFNNDLTLEELSYYQRDLVKEILRENENYNENTHLKDLDSYKYGYLQKPTLDSVVNHLEHMANDRNIKENTTEYQPMLSLIKKLKSIASYGSKVIDEKYNKAIPGYFCRYEKFNINSETLWMLFDMDNIKELDEYAPIQWILLNKIVRADMKEQLRLKELGLEEYEIYYLIEEAHNMFSNPLFATKYDLQGNVIRPGILDKYAKELRSYGMILAPISQESHHIPKEVFSSIQTKFFMFPSASKDGEGIDANVDEIRDLLKLDETKVDFMKNTEQFYATVINEHGTFMLHLESNDEIRNIIDGRA